jgi:type III secretion protein L
MDERIIKARLDADAPVVNAPNVLKKEVYQAGLDARRIVERAQREAEAILEEATRRGDETVEAARERGYRQGLAQWDAALRVAEQASQTLHEKHEAELVRLAVKIAEKIIGEELRTRPETIVSIVRECLRTVRHEQRLVIQVNPSESDLVERMAKRLREAVGLDRQIQIVADRNVAAGGCIVESEMGVIDARLETQLGRLEEILLRVATRQ